MFLFIIPCRYDAQCIIKMLCILEDEEAYPELLCFPITVPRETGLYPSHLDQYALPHQRFSTTSSTGYVTAYDGKTGTATEGHDGEIEIVSKNSSIYGEYANASIYSSCADRIKGMLQTCEEEIFLKAAARAQAVRDHVLSS
jgi:hypothetical protein